MNSKVFVVTGPMFSGKSSLLLNYAKKEQEILNKQVLIIGSKRDTRSNNLLQTHTGQSITTNILVSNLKELFEQEHSDLLKKAEIVIIDEGHFFNDLLDFVHLLLCIYESESLLNRSIYVGGLYTDSNGVPFEQMVQLIGLASKTIFLYSLCLECKNGTKAIYSKRLSKEQDQFDRFLPGGIESYKPVCRKCFLLNKK